MLENIHRHFLVGIAVFVIMIGVVGIGNASVFSDFDDQYVECEKWIEITSLIKQDYDYILKDALEISGEKCGFNVDGLTDQT